MRIARLLATDALRYRALMLEAYDIASDAFTSTAAERAGAPMAWWADRIDPADGLAEAFVALDGESLVGTVALSYSAKPKTRHAALVIGLYVCPAHRRSGAAAALMRAAMASASARPETQVLQLTVTEGNEPAIRLYRSLGFVAWGTEPMAIRTRAGFKGKVHMWLRLPRGAAVVPP